MEDLNLERLKELQTRLQDGWQFEPPVYIMTDPRRPTAPVYQFILWRDDQPAVVTLSDGPEVRQFIADCEFPHELV